MYGRPIRNYPPGPARALSPSSTLGVPVPGRDRGMTYVSLYPGAMPYAAGPVGMQSIYPRAVHGYGAADLPITADAPRAIPVTHEASQTIRVEGGLPEPVGYSIFGQAVYAGQALDPTRITDTLQGLGGGFVRSARIPQALHGSYVRSARRGPFGGGPDGL